eukprot:m.284685 g.284685  ORF g.284685 m.284685 type:complete len:564 (-) comp15767_c0_seq3:330-2021(-)
MGQSSSRDKFKPSEAVHSSQNKGVYTKRQRSHLNIPSQAAPSESAPSVGGVSPTPSRKEDKAETPGRDLTETDIERAILISAYNSQGFNQLRLAGCHLGAARAMLPPEAHSSQHNRYLNIVPNAATRVQMDSDESDYIMASWIRGNDKATHYIAAAAPLATTVDVYVQMLWECDVHFLLMIQQPAEQQIQPTFWPTTIGEDVLVYGDVSVRTIDRERHTNYTVITLHLQTAAQRRKLRVFVYQQFSRTSVPCTENGTLYPQPIVKLLLMLRQERMELDQMATPLVVQCDDGVGRTGTVIALDQVLTLLETDGSVDVLKVIKQLRQDLYFAVTSTAQYRFIYECALQYALFVQNNTATPDGRPGLVCSFGTNALSHEELASSPRWGQARQSFNSTSMFVLESLEPMSKATDVDDVLVYEPSKDGSAWPEEVVADPSDPSAQCWFRTAYTKPMVETILEMCPEGSFLLWTEKQAFNPDEIFTLSVRLQDSAIHTRITTPSNQYLLAGTHKPVADLRDVVRFLLSRQSDASVSARSPAEVMPHMTAQAARPGLRLDGAEHETEAEA